MYLVWRRRDFVNNVTIPKMMRLSSLMKTKDGFGKQALVQSSNNPNAMLLNCRAKEILFFFSLGVKKTKKAGIEHDTYFCSSGVSLVPDSPEFRSTPF